MDFLLLVILGLVAGTFGSLIGLGGGIITVPILLFFNELGWFPQPLEHQEIVALSLMAIIFTSVAATITNYKHKRIHFKTGLILFIGAAPAVVLGAIVGEFISGGLFYILFGVFMLFTNYLLSIQDRIKPLKIRNNISRSFSLQGEKFNYSYNSYFVIVVSAVAGFLAGIFGIGGGSIYVPMMIILFRFPVHIAAATSMFVILLTSIIGSLSHVFLGNFILLYVIAIGIGAYIGGAIGPSIAARLRSNTLVLILRLVLIIIAIKLIIEGIF